MVPTTCFQCFLMNGHLIQYQYIDIKKVHTGISSLTRIIHEKPASRGSWITFHENHARSTLVKICQFSLVFEKNWKLPLRRSNATEIRSGIWFSIPFRCKTCQMKLTAQLFELWLFCFIKFHELSNNKNTFNEHYLW